MKNVESISFPVAVSLVVGAVLSVPILGWWPLVGVGTAIGSALWFVGKLQ